MLEILDREGWVCGWSSLTITDNEARKLEPGRRRGSRRLYYKTGCWLGSSKIRQALLRKEVGNHRERVGPCLPRHCYCDSSVKWLRCQAELCNRKVVNESFLRNEAFDIKGLCLSYAYLREIQAKSDSLLSRRVISKDVGRSAYKMVYKKTRWDNGTSYTRQERRATRAARLNVGYIS